MKIKRENTEFNEDEQKVIIQNFFKDIFPDWKADVQKEPEEFEFSSEDLPIRWINGLKEGSGKKLLVKEYDEETLGFVDNELRKPS